MVRGKKHCKEDISIKINEIGEFLFDFYKYLPPCGDSVVKLYTAVVEPALLWAVTLS